VSRVRRVGSGRRRALVLVSTVALIVSLGVSVRRSADGTRIARELADLQRAERAAEAQAAEEVVRVDSLASRRRILTVAERMGLRPAHEGEILYLPDTTAPTGAGSEDR
jgi:cell division protein FtsL